MEELCSHNKPFFIRSDTKAVNLWLCKPTIHPAPGQQQSEHLYKQQLKSSTMSEYTDVIADPLFLVLGDAFRYPRDIANLLDAY